MLSLLEMVQRTMTYNGLGEPSSLEGVDGPSLASNAERFLQDENRIIQNDNSWSVCVRNELQLTRDPTTNKIAIPAGVMVIAVTGVSNGLDVVPLGGFLYDRKNHTDVFTQNVTVRVSYLYAPECLPEHIQSYVIGKAALRLCEFRGDGVRYRVIEERVKQAYQTARRVDGDVLRHTIETNPLTQRILGNFIQPRTRWT